MLRRSLTGKILVAVGLTVAVVIAIYTYFVIRVQSAWWHERLPSEEIAAAVEIHEHLATNRNLLIAYGALIFSLVSLVLWLLLVRLVSQPVSELLKQMRRVEHGDFSARAEAQRPDEIGELARDFNAMVRSLEAAKRELHESHEKQMQQAGKLASIGELASGIAHEIRNPLAGIGAAVEVLGDNGEITDEIRRQIKRLNTMLTSLLDFARQREPEFAPCDVSDIVRPMLTLVRPDAQKFHIEMVEELPADLPSIKADAGQAQQALLNVLLNAIQAMPEGGTLTVSAELNGNVAIRVRDTGDGISDENMRKIFSPFFTTKHRGTGLGLAITHNIMEKHGGRIGVESEAGRGTTFKLEFPHA